MVNLSNIKDLECSIDYVSMKDGYIKYRAENRSYNFVIFIGFKPTFESGISINDLIFYNNRIEIWYKKKMLFWGSDLCMTYLYNKGERFNKDYYFDD